MQQDSNNGGMTQYFPEPQSQRPLVENPENFSDPLVQMSEVTVRYSDGASVWTPLNNASVMIGPDRVTALLMPTTTDAVVVAQAMMGMIPLASGEVRILGRNVSTMGIKRLARLHSQDVATIMPESELAPTFTVEANIQAHFRMTGRAVDPAWLARVLEMAGIAEHRGTKYGLLDPCTQRLVDCAVALLQGPRVAIAAEPTAGLTGRSAQRVLDFLLSWVDEFGVTEVFTTSEPTIAAWADSVLIITNGAVLGEQRSPTEERLHEVMAGLSAPTPGLHRPRRHSPSAAAGAPRLRRRRGTARLADRPGQVPPPGALVVGGPFPAVAIDPDGGDEVGGVHGIRRVRGADEVGGTRGARGACGARGSDKGHRPPGAGGIRTVRGLDGADGIHGAHGDRLRIPRSDGGLPSGGDDVLHPGDLSHPAAVRPARGAVRMGRRRLARGPVRVGRPVLGGGVDGGPRSGRAVGALGALRTHRPHRPYRLLRSHRGALGALRTHRPYRLLRSHRGALGAVGLCLQCSHRDALDLDDLRPHLHGFHRPHQPLRLRRSAPDAIGHGSHRPGPVLGGVRAGRSRRSVIVVGRLNHCRPVPGPGGLRTDRGVVGLGGIRTRRGARDAGGPSGRGIARRFVPRPGALDAQGPSGAVGPRVEAPQVGRGHLRPRRGRGRGRRACLLNPLSGRLPGPADPPAHRGRPRPCPCPTPTSRPPSPTGST